MSKKYEGRVSELVRARLTVLLETRVADPRVAGITITDVEVTADTRYARVYYSLIGTDDDKAQAQRGLDSASGFLRHELGQTLRTKRTPELVFIHDESLERGERMAHLLDEVRERDAKKPE